MWEQLSVLPSISPGALEHNSPFYLLFIYTVEAFIAALCWKLIYVSYWFRRGMNYLYNHKPNAIVHRDLKPRY